MTFTIGTVAEMETDRTIVGHWFIADRPTVTMPGELKFDAEAGVRLSIRGSLSASVGFDSEFHQILGKAADGSLITIVGAWLEHQQEGVLNLGGEETRGVTSERWGGLQVAIGRLLPEGEETKIQAINITTHLMARWPAMNAPRYTPQTDQSRAGGTLEIPEPISWTLPDKVVTFRWRLIETHSGTGARIRLLPQFEVRFGEPTALSDIWDSAVLPILHLVSFCTGSGDYVESLIVPESDSSDIADTNAKDGYGAPLPADSF